MPILVPQFEKLYCVMCSQAVPRLYGASDQSDRSLCSLSAEV